MYDGRVTHHRRGTPEHRFTHPLTFFAIHLDETDAIARCVWPVGVERPGLMALRARDHWGDPRAPIARNMAEMLDAHGVDPGDGRGVLVTQLRQLGYVFNPISFLFWYRGNDPVAVVAEVANTFGERHPYVFTRDNARVEGGRWRMTTAKRMHVSPFLDMDFVYRFDVREPGDSFAAAITLVRGDDVAFHSTWTGRRRPLTSGTALRAFARRPLMPQRVMAVIHAEAARLSLKGAPFHRKPAFRVGRGSRPAEGGAAGTRRGLRPPPPARRSPLTPVVRGLSGLVLRRVGPGDLEVRHPDGRRDRTPGVGDAPPARIDVNSKDLYRRVARRGTTGVGEAYVAGDWDSPDPAAAMRALLSRAQGLTSHPLGRAGVALRAVRPRLPTAVDRVLAARQVGYHYDLGNDLYALFLDETMSYSCAVFAREGQDLADAQRDKWRGVCRALDLRPGQRVLEIGCGWGAFAALAAEECGVHVTGLTLSRDQHALARERLASHPARDRVEIRLQDYRAVAGTYDAVVSVEMIEAIGHPRLPEYFATVDRLLAPGGRAFVQAISVPGDRYARYRRSRDWISEYVFPGGNCPSLDAMTAAMSRSSRLGVRSATDIGPHYATTLRAWRRRFDAHEADVRALGFDEGFVRAWRFYLASCEAAFDNRALQDYQLVLGRSHE